MLRRRRFGAVIAAVAIGLGTTSVIYVVQKVITGGPSSGLCTPPAGHTSWFVSPNGNNTTGTSWATAWTTLPNIVWTGITAGDTVYLDGGGSSVTYTNQTLTVGKTGTQANPITICPGQDAGHNGTAIIDYGGDRTSTATTAINFNGHNWVTVSGNYNGGQHLQVQNLYSSTNDTNTAGIGYYAGGGLTGPVIDHVHFIDVGNAIRINTPTQATVEYSTIDNPHGDVLIGLVDASGGAFDTNLVHDNTLNMQCNACITGASTNSGPDGIQDGNGMSIYNNTLTMTQTSAYVPSLNQHPDMIQNHGSQFMKIYSNTFTNVGDSQFDWDMVNYGMTSNCTPHDVYIYNNIFRITTTIDPSPEEMRIYDACVGGNTMTNVKILSNLFIDDTTTLTGGPVAICETSGTHQACNTTSSSGNEIGDNIFYNLGGGTSSTPMLNLGSTAGTGWTPNSNIYFRSSNGFVTWKGTSLTAASMVSTIDLGGHTAAPGFVSYVAGSPSNDFHLFPGGIGTNSAIINGLNYSTYFTTDKDGAARPLGTNAWDVGPYEKTAPAGGGGLPSTHVCSGRSFYISELTGSDSNNGTSKATPWKDAYGMRGFSATYVHQAHDCFYFKGGEIWGSGTFPMEPAAGGDGTDNMYYGPDYSWFIGVSWTRPEFTAANSVITGSCTDITGNADSVICMALADHVTFDDIEIANWTAGSCSGNDNCTTIFLYQSFHDLFDHMYIHNLTATQSANFTNAKVMSQATFGPESSTVLQNSYIQCATANNVLDATRAINFIYNSYIAGCNGMVFPSGDSNISGNTLIDCNYNGFPTGVLGAHADALQVNPVAAPPAHYTVYFHNNIVGKTGNDANGNECEAALIGNIGETDYVYNNIFYDLKGNGISLVQDNNTPPDAYFIWNNTITGGGSQAVNYGGYCIRQGHGGTIATGVVQNNYCDSNQGVVDPALIAATTSYTANHNVLRTSAQATSDGMTDVQSPYVFFPPTGAAPTVDVGVSLAANCTGTLTDLCSDTSYGVTVNGNNRVVTPARTPLARPQGVTWDDGAYDR